MKPKKFTPAHESGNFAELVCSNSLKSNDVWFNACGLLKEEMRMLGSLTMEAAAVPPFPPGRRLPSIGKSFPDMSQKSCSPIRTFPSSRRRSRPFPTKMTGTGIRSSRRGPSLRTRSPRISKKRRAADCIFTTPPRPSSRRRASICPRPSRGIGTARERGITSTARWTKRLTGALWTSCSGRSAPVCTSLRSGRFSRAVCP